ncbi:hypothetical protein ncot_15010 [Nocardioides sp. JQ2195]|uniref:hypothetical protein n=1 Tax=Nocardioides sp. JQ2195 TaxID=2592334 RepID=UPI00143EBB1C|nr:hypothetical protein [Nocardioides sp. JQ2195]QIX27758.1 hypothetical protein ncot_15010 [Nocardioides sp. JQ2195]
MRRLVLSVVSGLIITLLAPAAPASADVGFTQVGVERQFKKFTISYRRSCPSCTSTWYPPSSNGDPVKTATGKATVRVTTFKIREDNGRRDLYAIDVDVAVTNRKGDEDWGWMDVRVQSTGRTRIYDAIHTQGIGATNKDTKSSYPITLSAGYGPISAGATIGYFVSEAKGSSLVAKQVARGRQWRVNKVNGVYHATTGRIVRVGQGKLPTFRVVASANKDGATFTCQQWSDGYHCFVPRGFVTKSARIGTRRLS